MSTPTTIHLTTFIAAPPQRVFDLSRSVAVVKKVFSRYESEAIAGTSSGLLKKDETVTWTAKLLGKKRFLKLSISSMELPDRFTDEMVSGDFKAMKHEHFFKPVKNGTLMIEFFSFEPPFGAVGRLASALFLREYLRTLLELRNSSIKQYAESDSWKILLAI